MNLKNVLAKFMGVFGDMISPKNGITRLPMEGWTFHWKQKNLFRGTLCGKRDWDWRRDFKRQTSRTMVRRL